MPYLTYAGYATGHIPGMDAFEPGERRWVNDETAAAFAGHSLFMVEPDPTPEPPAPAPEKPTKAAKPAATTEGA